MAFDYCVHKLTGSVQHYSWGGTKFLPQLLTIENPNHAPFAEYWLGVHAGGPASVEVNQQSVLLSDIIASDPVAALSAPVYEQFGGLPYLFKVLDVKDMLSIQVHPTKEYAKVAFEKEEAAGVALDAPNRNYKDQNHKPEIMLAMSEFWLLHGFKSEAKILETLENSAEFQVLAPLYKSEGLAGLYTFLMEMEQAQVDSLLGPVIKRALRNKQDGKIDKTSPEWWVAKLYENSNGIYPIDKGVFSIYLFNIVCIMPGQGIFQDAGVPHAYLEGQNVELMANSDNVLRGGLTPKHIDIEELNPRILKVWSRYLHPEEFAIFDTTSIYDLTVAWTIKEALFKLNTKTGIDFKNDLRIKSKEGNTFLCEIKSEDGFQTVKMETCAYKNLIISYNIKQ